jgi:hypothetical protein
MKPRVLIVGTVPYNKMSTSRALKSYFNNWEKENLAQVFSHAKKPTKGQCSKFFQITDQRILKRWFNKNIKTGVLYEDSSLEEEWSDYKIEVRNNFFKKLYSLGSSHTPFTHLARKILWKKKYWCTKEFLSFIDDFKPECVFLCFSDDFFINEIALFVAKRFNIPIVSSIGDDYYFNYKFSLSPLYHIYKNKYRRIIKKILTYSPNSIYIGNKIRDKYNSFFNIENGQTVYLTSDIIRKEFKSINKDNPIISYFGNISLGRNESLSEIAFALGKINPNYRLHVYSNERKKKYLKVFKKNPYLIFEGNIPYSEVLKRTNESDIVILVEGFKKNDVNITRYSLSTKAADSLGSGSNVFVYGSLECGLVEYMKDMNSSMVCTSKDQLINSLNEFINNIELQYSLYQNAITIFNKHHTLDVSTSKFESVILNAINNFNK